MLLKFSIDINVYGLVEETTRKRKNHIPEFAELEQERSFNKIQKTRPAKAKRKLNNMDQLMEY